ncbi:hypothetical protein FYJ43_00340 [Cutibacterium sp. WCA-380-WT-3A]|uniref:Uncharacterized protein n=1 Tax=Cutibacterium porci TaxID=2605781 RepID=A0A7K0J3P1_9ACTN|nr:hypothetical protein [Cutibacterium porci]
MTNSRPIPDVPPVTMLVAILPNLRHCEDSHHHRSDFRQRSAITRDQSATTAGALSVHRLMAQCGHDQVDYWRSCRRRRRRGTGGGTSGQRRSD